LVTPPASLLTANDSQFLVVDVVTTSTKRTVSTVFTGNETTFTLLPAVSDITYTSTGGKLTATWSSLPAYDSIVLDALVSTSATDFSAQAVRVSRGGSRKRRDRSRIRHLRPGYDGSWTLDLTGPYSRDFGVEQTTDEITYDSLLEEGVNGAVRSRPGHQRLSKECLENALARGSK